MRRDRYCPSAWLAVWHLQHGHMISSSSTGRGMAPCNTGALLLRAVTFSLTVHGGVPLEAHSLLFMHTLAWHAGLLAGCVKLVPRAGVCLTTGLATAMHQPAGCLNTRV